jgi:molybdopterin/thiamine biosynthesis adenylyltransferase
VARFSDDEIRRYGRQMALREVGGDGQERLRAGRAAARSSLEALYLAGAGVGQIVVGSEALAVEVRALNPLVDVSVDATLVVDGRAGAQGALDTCRSLLCR